MRRFTSLLAAFAAAVLTIAGCSGGKQPAAELSTYVKAYTGGVISGNSTIRVEFTSGFGAGKSAEDLISFSPAVRGEARWAENSVLEFIPDEGELTPGKAYDASVRLDRIVDVRKGSLKKFEFSFAVAPKVAAVEVTDVKISTSDPSEAAVSGIVSFSSDMPSDKVEETLAWSYSGAGGHLSVAPGEGVGEYAFTVSGLKRSSSDNSLEVSVNASKYGYREKEKTSVTIPSTSGFSVIGAKRIDAAEPYVDVTFSQPLDNTQSPDGLFTLTDVGRFYYQKDGNRMRIYYESTGSGSVTVNVSGSVRDISGNALGQDWSETFTSSELDPAVEIKLDGSILPDPSQLVLPFVAQNLSAVDIHVIKIFENNVLGFLQDNDLNGDSNLRRSGRLIYRTTLRLDRDPSVNLHRCNLFSVELSDMMKSEPGAIYRIRLSFRREYSLYGKGGVSYGSLSDSNMITLKADGVTEEDQAVWDTPESYYYESFADWSEYRWNDRDNPATASYYMDSDRFPVVNLISSDIGLVVKYADGDALWVAANDILTTNPLKGADLTVYNYQLQKIGGAKTDGKGLAEVRLDGKPFVLTARNGRSIAYLKVADGLEKSLSRFDTGGRTVTKGLKGYVYGERGVWRPGDTLHVTLLVQDREGRLPEGHPVTMEVYTPQGQFYQKQVSTGGMNGFYSFDIATASDDPTGTWNAYFKVGGATFHKALPVETVKPNRLKVALDVKAAGALSSGMKTELGVASSWLTGPAAAGMKTKVEMSLSLGQSSFKGYDAYSFRLPGSSFQGETCDIFERTLDASGKTSASVTMPKVSDAPGMLQAQLITRVFEPGGDASINTVSMPYSPFSSYVGIKSPSPSGDGWLETDKDHVFNLVVLDSDGKKVSGHELEYKIFKIDWSWWYESRSESYDSYINSSYAEVVSSGRIKAADGTGSFSFKVEYPSWGRYLVYVKDLDGGHATGDVVSIDWPSWRGRSDKADPSALTMLTFTTDKSSYKAGETAVVYIPAAKGGRALVSLENASRVISQSWVSTSDTETKYSFKVTDEMAPNFYVHITLLQPHRQTANDLPIRMYGVQGVLVTDESSHLNPVITAPEAIRPQEKFSIKVKEAQGKPMTYTLAIVDEGLLDITSFKTPDPWSEMYAKEALGVRTWDLYDDVVGAYAGRLPSLMSIGGDASLDRSKVRDNRFNPVVAFYGPFTLKSGTATHDITLPMYVGSVRVMVVAGNGTAYGNAEKTVPVRSPLMVLPTLPRVMGCGETVTLPVNVFAMEDKIRDVKVSVRTEGPLKVSGGQSQTISFSGTGDQLVRFALEASDVEGPAKVTVTAEGAGYKATETVNISVRNPNPVITGVVRKMIPEGGSQMFTWDGKGALSAQLEIASFPSIDMNGMFSYVRDYSYSCTEQLSARGMSLVYAKDLLNDENSAKADELIPEILQQLYSRQLSDGGFAYWPGASSANEWASSMAGQFMTEAQAKGFKVDAGVLNSWKVFQKKCVTNYRKSKSQNLDDLQQAYRLYTLALAGAADEGAMNRLKGAGNLSVQAAWRLAAAYAVRGKVSVAKEIVSGIPASVGEYSDDLTFGSGLRDKAMMLETMVRLDDMTGALTLAREVADGMSEDSYSTESIAFGSVAMGLLAGKMNTSAISASVDGKEVRSAKAVCSTDLVPSEGKVEVKNGSNGAVYASVATTSQASYGTATAAHSSGLGVSVRFTDAKGAPIAVPVKVAQGSDIYETIEVTNLNPAVSLTNLALVQMLPSGWEVFNDRLYGTASVEESEYDRKDIRDDSVSWFFTLLSGSKKTFRIRLQASYEGTFILPAASCEAMYDNRISGNSASSTVTVSR